MYIYNYGRSCACLPKAPPAKPSGSIPPEVWRRAAAMVDLPRADVFLKMVDDMWLIYG